MENEAPVQVNDVIADKYRIDRILGAGGMGIVVAATHLELGQPVALKFLLNELAHREELVARFLREARNCVSISSEHVVRVADVSRLPSGAPYMVMEYLDGHDLEAELQQKGPLPVAQVVELALQTCIGLAEAHRGNLVHRDLKPANLFLTTRSDGVSILKILDFGISKSLNAGGADHALTRTNQSMGTPFYMSPEQVRATPDIDFRTDIWSLGAILYEILSGAPPFSAESASAVCAQVLEASPQPLLSHRSDVPEALWNIIIWCLRKSPNDRPSNVAELAAALAPLAPGSGLAISTRVARILGVQTTERALAVSPPTVGGSSQNEARAALGHSGPVAGRTDTSFASTGWPSTPPSRRRTTTIVGVAAAAVVFVGAMTLSLLSGSEPEAEAPAVASSGVENPEMARPEPPPPPPPSAAPIVAVNPTPSKEAEAKAESAKKDTAAEKNHLTKRPRVRWAPRKKRVRPAPPIPASSVKVRPVAPAPPKPPKVDPLDGL